MSEEEKWDGVKWDEIPNASEIPEVSRLMKPQKTQWEINQERIARVGSSRRYEVAKPVVEIEAGTWDYPTCSGSCGEEVLPQYAGVYTSEGAFCQACAQDMMDALLRSPLGLLVGLWIRSYANKRGG